MSNVVKQKITKEINILMNKVMGSGLAQEENMAEGDRHITKDMPETVRALAEEGIILLKNDDHLLPLYEERCVSVFGRVQHDWFYVGYGSGGDVHAPYEVDIFQGMDDAGIAYNKELKAVYDAWCEKPANEADHGYWGHWPYYYEEMPVTEDLVKNARSNSDVALIIIGRAAGEDRENALKPGSYYLTDIERDMIEKVTAQFSKTILLMDCGNIVDMSFVEEYSFTSILYAWQLGQENGHAVANILAGKANPSGKLSDTIAKHYEDYPSSANFGNKQFNNYAEDIYVGYRYFQTFAPENVLYPFGYGLSYTTFTQKVQSVEEGEKTGDFTFNVRVTNVGVHAGKEVVQLYVSAPTGKLGKPERVLAGFAKTELLEPGSSEVVTIQIHGKDYSSFDDIGRTLYKDAFVLEAGTYTYHVGSSLVDTVVAHTWELEDLVLVEQCQEVCILDRKNPFEVLHPLGLRSIAPAKNGLLSPAAKVKLGGRNLKRRILENLPDEIPQTGDKGIRLVDIRDGKNTMEEFIAQLSDRELMDLTRGDGPMNSSLGYPGNAGAFGGITQSLRAKGIPALITADGPAGLRLRTYATLMPCGTAIACTWNPELVEEAHKKLGEEAAFYKVDVNLSPGMNIHRDPLCGRNFEYYSEDPLLSGKTAAATTRGLQAGGTSACPKHFACNNQEVNRNYNDSRVSMRALREIYLKNFEYCVKEGKPQNLMTSYNKVNGVWSHYNYDLVTTVLRGEWGYEGNVVTDWWMRKDTMPEFPKVKNNAYRVRAQVDVLMPGNLSVLQQKGYKEDKDFLKNLGKDGYLTRAELQRSAANVLRFAMTRLK